MNTVSTNFRIRPINIYTQSGLYNGYSIGITPVKELPIINVAFVQTGGSKTFFVFS